MIICGQVELEFGYVELVELHGVWVELAVSLGLGVFVLILDTRMGMVLQRLVLIDCDYAWSHLVLVMNGALIGGSVESGTMTGGNGVGIYTRSMWGLVSSDWEVGACRL